MNSSQQQYLQALGILRWEKRNQPKLMLICEKTFTDQAKKLLTAMLSSIGLATNDVTITIISTEILQQISQINPQLLILCDEKSCQLLLNTTSPMEDLRQKINYVEEKKWPAIVTFHPEYLLQHPIAKKKAYADLLFIQQYLAGKNAWKKAPTN